MVEMCEYKFCDGKKCKEEALRNSKYCILHVELPKDEECEEFKGLNKLKEEKVKEKISKGDFNFEGAKLFEVYFFEMTIKGSLAFYDAVIKKHAWFEGAKIGGDAGFTRAKIGGAAFFGGAEIGGAALFQGAEIGGGAWFEGAKIDGAAFFGGAKLGKNASFYGIENITVAQFGGAEIGGAAQFERAKIGGNASFVGAEIGGGAWFQGAEIGGNASFHGAKIDGDSWFNLTEIKGACSFEDAVFKEPGTQEEACRTARKTQERIGNRVSGDYHFYREMEAKRKQKYLTFSLKPILKLMCKIGLEKLIDKHKEIFGKERRIYWGFLELPVQYIFGYGVHPRNVIATWLLTVIALAFVYWIGNGVLVGGELEVAADSFGEYFYFSVVTAATPGYGGYKPVPGFYQGLASFEAIFGTFMWAAFIATFARKYMR